jgi:hypothetical protein
MKVEVFAAVKGFKKAMMEDRVKKECVNKDEKLTKEETAISILDLVVQGKCTRHYCIP